MNATDEADKTINKLLSKGAFADAEAAIDAAEKLLPLGEHHRALAWRSELAWQGKNDGASAIKLLQEACRSAPTYLPHAYSLGILQQDVGDCTGAVSTFEALIKSGNDLKNEYFSDEAKFRLVLCLRAIGRCTEAHEWKVRLPENISIFVGDRLMGIDDL